MSRCLLYFTTCFFLGHPLLFSYTIRIPHKSDFPVHTYIILLWVRALKVWGQTSVDSLSGRRQIATIQSEKRSCSNKHDSHRDYDSDFEFHLEMQSRWCPINILSQTLLGSFGAGKVVGVERTSSADCHEQKSRVIKRVINIQASFASLLHLASAQPASPSISHICFSYHLSLLAVFCNCFHQAHPTPATCLRLSNQTIGISIGSPNGQIRWVVH